MKIRKWLAVLIAACLLAMPAGIAETQAPVTGDEIAIDEANFPDAGFRAFVARYDADKSGGLSPEETAKVSYMDVSGKGIADLTGIENFAGLKQLLCQGNQLKALDVRRCPLLVEYIGANAYQEFSSYASYGGEDGLVQFDPGVALITAADVPVDEANFPDAVFRAFIAPFDTDESGALSLEELAAVSSMDVSGKGIADLTGIEYFTALTALSCQGNSLKALDVSHSPALAAYIAENTYQEYEGFAAYGGEDGALKFDAGVTLIIAQPENVKDVAEATVTFKVTALNAESYQWQWAKAPAEGEEWTWKATSAEGNKTDALTVNATVANTKLYLRCAIKGVNGEEVYSEKVRFTLPDAKITAQPENVREVTAETVTFKIAAEDAVSYQWQWASAPAKGHEWTWKSTSAEGNKTEALTVNATMDNSKLYFRCAVTGSNGNKVYSLKARFMLPDAKFTSQPESVENVTAETVTFTVAAEDAVSYQWQWAKAPANGEEWTWKSTSAEGSKTDTLTVNATAANAKLYFRCAVTGSNGNTVYSEKANFALPAAKITAQPESVENVTAETVTFKVTAEDAESYQWQWAKAPAEGEEWTWKPTSAEGNKTDTLTVNATASNAKLYFRCAITGAYGNVVYSETARFTLPEAKITAQPESVENVTAETVTFKVTAEDAESYQWQWAKAPAEGEEWEWKTTGAEGSKTDTLTVNATAANAKLYFRCAVTSAYGTVVYSEKVSFTLPEAKITAQPESVENVTEETVTFKITAEDAASYQWQWAKAPAEGEEWTWKPTSAEGSKTDTLTVNATAANAKLYFRCAVTGSYGNVVYSEKASFTLPGAKITAQPEDAENVTEETVTFTVAAENAKSYQWQWAKAPAEGEEWEWKATGAEGSKTEALTVNATAANAKLYFRCAVTGTYGGVVYSEKVHFTLPGAKITAQPEDAENVTEETVTFTVAAENAKSYQWQWAKAPAEGKEWVWKATGAEGSKTDTLTVNVTAANAKLYFRCAVTGTYGGVVYSEKVHFTLPDAKITAQPEDASAGADATVTFKIKAEDAVSYQWQWASAPAKGKAWKWAATSAEGNKTDTLTVNATASNAKLYFRCAVTGSNGNTVYSEMAHFSLGEGVKIISQPESVENVTDTTVSFKVVAENAESYQWQWAVAPVEGQEWMWRSTAGEGNKTDTLTMYASTVNTKLFLRCAITGTNGSVVYTEMVHFTLAPQK